MPVSPLSQSNGLLSVEILLGGTPIKAAYPLFSVEVDRQLYTVPQAKFIIQLPGGATGDEAFEISESAAFAAGKSIAIKAGYDGRTDQIFSGLISRSGLKVGSDGAPQLIIHCLDKTVQMSFEQKIDAFTGLTDGEVIKKIIAGYELENDIATTTRQYPQIVQAGTTDWDFARSRAAASGLLLYAEDGKVFAQKPHLGADPELVVTYGRDVLQFEARFAAGYERAAHQLSNDNSIPQNINRGGNLGGRGLTDVSRAGNTAIPPSGSLEWPTINSRLAALQGRVSFEGHASPRLNTPIELAGLGKRFNGEALISSIRHTISAGNWVTETGFGLVQTKQNSYQAITTQNGFRIEFNDQENTLTVASPGGNKIVLSDEDKSITITDQHENTVTMESGGITLKSGKDITLDAGGKISLKAVQEIDISSSAGDVSLTGNNVSGKGKIGIKMTGGATAELSAAGQTTVKGAMVMIN